ncbi:MAG: nuclear transport factor 2 family protein [Acidobacteriota bacterium]
MSQENVQIVEGFYQAMSRGDIGGVLGALDPKIEWNEAENFVYADHSPYLGTDDLLNGLFMRLMTEWEGFKALPEKFIGSGDTVAVTGRYQGTFRATGKPMNAQMVHVFTLAEGKIVRFQQYTDTAQFRDVVS